MTTLLVVCLLLLCVLILFALWLKGDVRARFKLPLLTFSLDVKDKVELEKRPEEAHFLAGCHAKNEKGPRGEARAFCGVR